MIGLLLQLPILQQLAQRHRIDDVFFGEPGAPSDFYTVDEVFFVRRVMGVAINGKLTAEAFCNTHVGVVEIHTLGRGINLQRHMMFGAGLENGFHIESNRLTLIDESAHRMAQNFHIPRLHRSQNALRLIFRREAVIEMR